MAQSPLISVTCPTCHHHLGEFLPGSSVWCKRCQRWVTRKETSPRDKSTTKTAELDANP